jgi:hypothetical protein
LAEGGGQRVGAIDLHVAIHPDHQDARAVKIARKK